MKWLSSFFLISALVTIIFAADNSDKAKEIEDIKTVIINETEYAVNKRDYKNWADTWVHESDVLHFMADRSGYRERNGWDEINSWMKKGIENDPEPRHFKITKKNFNVRVDGNLAWASYDDYWDTPEGIWHMKQTRTLIKKDEQWKIISVIAAWDDSYKPDFNNGEMFLSMVGQDYLLMDKVNEAIDVFKLNVKLYPKSSKAYDSLGEAYTKFGNKELAIKSYQKSLELDPENKNAKKKLEELSVKK